MFMAREPTTAEMERLNFLVLQIQFYNKYLSENCHSENLETSKIQNIQNIEMKRNELRAELSTLTRTLNYKPYSTVKDLF